MKLISLSINVSDFRDMSTTDANIEMVISEVQDRIDGLLADIGNELDIVLTAMDD